MTLRFAISALSAAALALASQAQAATTEAIANATVQPGGVRTGSSGTAFLNIEGSSNGSFASFGAIRFDTGAVKTQFDAQYGAGNWTISQISLQLTQSNAAFTTNGDVGIYVTGNDTVALTAPSTLTYAGFGTAFADASRILSYGFQQSSSGVVDSYTLYSQQPGQSAGADALLADVMGSAMTTLLLRDQSAGVAATYAGYANATYSGPTLVIDAVSAVPEPASLLLLVTGLAVVAVRSRRRP